jgi:hypothetical protein
MTTERYIKRGFIIFFLLFAFLMSLVLLDQLDMLR